MSEDSFLQELDRLAGIAMTVMPDKEVVDECTSDISESITDAMSLMLALYRIGVPDDSMFTTWLCVIYTLGRLQGRKDKPSRVEFVVREEDK